MAGDEPGRRCNHGIQSRAEGAGATVRAEDRYTYTVAQARFGCPGLGLYVIPGSMDRGEERSWGGWAGPRRPGSALTESVMTFCRVAQFQQWEWMMVWSQHS